MAGGGGFASPLGAPRTHPLSLLPPPLSLFHSKPTSPEVKKDFSTAILERKKSPNRLVVDDATNDDNR